MPVLHFVCKCEIHFQQLQQQQQQQKYNKTFPTHMSITIYTTRHLTIDGNKLTFSLWMTEYFFPTTIASLSCCCLLPTFPQPPPPQMCVVYLAIKTLQQQQQQNQNNSISSSLNVRFSLLLTYYTKTQYIYA